MQTGPLKPAANDRHGFPDVPEVGVRRRQLPLAVVQFADKPLKSLFVIANVLRHDFDLRQHTGRVGRRNSDEGLKCFGLPARGIVCRINEVAGFDTGQGVGAERGGEG